MGGVTGVPIYEKLGIELVKLFTEPDSNFPNHHPDPTVTENLAGLHQSRERNRRRSSELPGTATATESALSMKLDE